MKKLILLASAGITGFAIFVGFVVSAKNAQSAVVWGALVLVWVIGFGYCFISEHRSRRRRRNRPQPHY